MLHYLKAVLVLQIALYLTNNVPTVYGGSMGNVRCRVGMDWSKEFSEAHDQCAQKMFKEHKDHDGHKGRKPFHPINRNMTLEEFDFDDRCITHCIYETIGMLPNDDALLPEKKEVSKIITQGKVSEEHYTRYTSLLESCIDKVEKISTDKKLDKCKTAALLQFCFTTAMRNDEMTMEIEC